MQSGTPEQFDPYLGWLGISPNERPVNHYRLLGLQMLEADPAIIRAAADERMAMVRKYQTGPKASYTEQLLNDLAAAKLCLLNPNTKLVYDSGLLQAAEEQRVAPSTPLRPPAVPAQAAEFPTDHDPPHDWSQSSEPSPFYVQNRFLAVLAAFVLLLGGAILVVGILMNRPTSRAPQTGPIGGDTNQPGIETSTADGASGSELPVTVYPEANGEIQLTAASALLEGQLQFAVREREGAIVGWNSTEDQALWRFKSMESGIYRIEIEYSITADADGGEIELRIGDQTKIHTLSSRGGPDVFVTDELFLTVARRGKNQLAIRPITPTAQGLMALRSLRLKKR